MRLISTLCRLLPGLVFYLMSGLTVKAQSKLYGVTQSGFGSATAVNGAFFSLQNDGTAFKTEYALPSTAAPGGAPYGTPISYNGKFYGLTSNPAVLFEYDPVGGNYNAKYQFADISQNSNADPQADLVVFNGILYGMTEYGGANNAGMIFSYDPTKNGDAGFTELYDFDGAGNGGNPSGDLIVYNNKLYGMTTAGGNSGAGIIFSFDPAQSGSAAFQKIYDFDGSSAGTPYGFLTVFNGKFYGMASVGGAYSSGVIFSYDPAKTGAAGFADLFDFDNGSHGGTPYGSFLVYNSKLYGMTYGGGESGVGIIFSYDPSKTGSAAFADLYDFDNTNGGQSDGGSLIVYNNLFYGVTFGGGPNDQGVAFSFDPSQTGANAYKNLYDFLTVSGYEPASSLLAYNGQLYGLNSSGGGNYGTLFSIDPATSNVALLVSLNSPAVDIGLQDLIASKGVLYSITSSSSSPGTIVSFNPVTGEFDHLYTFTNASGGGPTGDIVKNGDIIYGISSIYGGTADLYAFNTVTSQFQVVHQFATGANPRGDLTIDNNKLYGSTTADGANSKGVLFSYDLSAGTYTSLLNYTTSVDFSGNSPLVVLNKKLYGYGFDEAQLTSYVFSYDLTTNTGVQVYAFPKVSGTATAPDGNLAVINGLLYGSTSNDGTFGLGTLFSLDPVSKTYSKLYDLSNATGSGTADLTAYNNQIYGVLEGTNFNGSVISFDPATAASLKVLHTFSGSDPSGYAPTGILEYTPLIAATITFGNIAKTYGNADFAPGATSTNTTTPITYQSSDTTIAKVAAGGQIHILGAGTAKIVASQPAGDTYLAASDTVTLTVNKAPLAISARDTAIVSGAAIPASFTITYISLVNGDNRAVLGGAVTATTTATSASPAGVYPITVMGPVTNANYNIMYTNAKLTISNGAPVIAFGSDFPTQLIYGAAPFDPGATSSSGTAPVYTTSDPTVATVTANGQIKIVGAGMVTITASFAAGNNFSAGSSAKTLTVAPAPLTITAQNQQRQYEAADLVFTAAYAGFVNGDASGSLTMAPQFTTTAVASSLPGVYPISVCCAASPNYTFTYVSGELTITGNQDVTFGVLSVMTYGGAPFDPGATANSGLTPTYTTDNPAVAVISGGQVRITGAGIANITATFPTSGSYLSTSATQQLTVQPKQLTIQADNISRPQGQPNPALTVSYTGFVNGDTYLSLTQQPVVMTTATTNSPVGTYPITVSGAVAYHGNYTIGYAGGTLTIIAPRSLIFNPLADEIYGTPDFGAGITNATGETVQYSSSDPNVAVIDNGTIHITGVGITTLTATLPANASYPAATTVSQSLTVDPANLVVTANDLSKTYLQPNPPLTISYQGFVNGETSSVLNGQPVAATSATTSSYQGVYPITVSGGSAQNYTLQYVAGMLTINPSSGADTNSMTVLQRSRSQLDVNIYLTDQEPVVILLYDLGGRLLNSVRPLFFVGFNTYSFNVGNLPAGVYIVKAIGNGWSLQQKVMIH